MPFAYAAGIMRPDPFTAAVPSPMFRLRLIAAALSAAALLTAGASAAAVDHKHPLPARPTADAPVKILGGTLEAFTVIDARRGGAIRYFALRESSGQRVGLHWLGAADSVVGSTVQVEGRASGGTLFVEQSSTVAPPPAGFRDAAPAGAKRYAGTLEILHVDDPDNDRCELMYALKDADGRHRRLDFAVVPDVLEKGMQLSVDGVAAADDLSIDPAIVTIEAGRDTAADREAPAIAGTTQVLVMLIKYADTATEPYTRDAITSTMFTGASSVANYYREASYGKHTLAGTVTPWLKATFNRPTTCDYSKVSGEATRLAGLAGYTMAAYQKYVFVFPSLPGCGWMGLGGGAYAWINQAASTLVIGHELGHTFGLSHAASLSCTNGGVRSVVDGTCTRSEYGDGYEIMGNGRAAHFNAPHKEDLGYIDAASLKVHKGGTATYTLSPIEVAGGATYAVKVPASAQRTYYLEWRQPVGFDAGLPTGVTNGVLVHTAYPSENYCDTCLLDMTTATATHGDAALPVGQTYTDAKTSTSFRVVSQTASALTVSVTSPLRPTYSDVPTTHSAYTAIETIAWHGIAEPCGTAPLRFCPDRAITRAEVAVMLERAKRGAAYAFPAATGTKFADVPATHWAAKYIEQMLADGITSGCAANPLRYCPEEYLTRAAVAPFLLRARYGSTFNPGTGTGTVFTDVPRTHVFVAWIELLYNYQVTLGCTANPRQFCPNATLTRAQVALFIQRMFYLATPPL